MPAKIENKHDHTCQSCHTILEKLASLTPDTISKFIADLKSSLSESTSTNSNTSTSSSPPSTKQQNVNQVQKGNTSHVAPDITTDRPKSPVRPDSRSPSRGLRQCPTPRQRIQLKKNNSKIDFSVLEDEESMECGALPPQHRGKSPPQTPLNLNGLNQKI